MPCKECLRHATLRIRNDGDVHFWKETRKEWLPKSSHSNTIPRLQRSCDNMSGGMQYWHWTVTQKNAENGDEYSRAKLGMGLNNCFSKTRHLKCATCGGNVCGPVLILNSMDYVLPGNVHQCVFKREYCDVIGPCDHCCLFQKRNALLQKQYVEFPQLEVNPRRLVAPALVKNMMTNNTIGRQFENDHGKSGLEFPLVSHNKLNYMRKEAGSSKQKRSLCMFIKEKKH